jgi:hypothetical protein
MPDIGSITAAISGLKTAAEIAKGFLDLKEIAAVQGKSHRIARSNPCCPEQCLSSSIGATLAL